MPWELLYLLIGPGLAAWLGFAAGRWERFERFRAAVQQAATQIQGNGYLAGYHDGLQDGTELALAVGGAVAELREEQDPADWWKTGRDAG